MNADCKSIMPIQIRVILTIALLAFALPSNASPKYVHRIWVGVGYWQI